MKLTLPSEFVAYTEDDVDRDRAMLMYADMLRTMRTESAEGQRWDARFYRTSQAWPEVKTYFNGTAGGRAVRASKASLGFEHALWGKEQVELGIAQMPGPSQPGRAQIVLVLQPQN